MKGEEEERDAVNKMIKDGLVPNLEHSVPIDNGFERVRAERAQRDGEKAKHRSYANKYSHFLCDLQWRFIPAKVSIPVFHFFRGKGKRSRNCGTALQKLAPRSKRPRSSGSVLECAGPPALWQEFEAFSNRLRLVNPALAFRIERVVNNKLTLENFVVR